jgi:hypothetical protein
VNVRRRVPYPGADVTVHVPTEIWHRSLEVLRLYGSVGSEGLVFWGGTITAASIQVTGLYIPGHEPQGGRVKLTREEGHWLLHRLQERDEKLLAQFHSHGESADHSDGDDERAASAHVGFFSLVAPDFGREVAMPTQCGVHEYNGTGFRRLGEDEVSQRIVIEALFEEHRAIPQGPSPPKCSRGGHGYIRSYRA